MDEREITRFLSPCDDNPAWMAGKEAGEMDRADGKRYTADELADAASQFGEEVARDGAPLSASAIAAYYVLGYLAATCGN